MIKQYQEKITPSGIIAGMPDTVYHATDGFISSSGLTVFNRSPAHYKFGKPKERTRNMEIGSALHTAVLEPEIYKNKYMTLEGVTARTAAAYKQAIKHRLGEFTLTQPEGDGIITMQQSVYAHKRASEILTSAKQKELSVFVECPITEVMVRIRIDILGGGIDDGYAVDLKTTRDARDQSFSRSVFDYRYHCQAALYMDAWEWATGEKLKGFKLLAIESELPHSIKVYNIDDISLMIGRRQYQADLINYAECLNKNDWPHYDDGTQDDYIALPEWVMRAELGE